ncbi:MAG: hypothetical protein FK733_16005 [Asgard group archaeon]|nr:hypothetical protein [Asgard group archaeon]
MKNCGCYLLSEDNVEIITKLTTKLKEGAREGPRAEAAKSLGRLGEDAKEAIPILIEAMKNDQSARVRGRAALALGRINNQSAVADMISVMMNDKDEQVRSRVAWALGDLGEIASDAIIPLKEAVKLDKNKDRAFYFIISTAKLEGSKSEAFIELQRMLDNKELETWQIIRFKDLVKHLELQDKIDEASEGITSFKEGAKNVQAEVQSLRAKVETQSDGQVKTDLLNVTSILQRMIDDQQKTIERQEMTIVSLNEALRDLVKTHQQAISDPRITPEQYHEFREQQPKEKWIKRNLFGLIGAIGTLLGGIAAVLGWLSSSLGWFG